MTKLIERNTTIPTRKSRDLLDGRGQPAVGGDPRAAGRARDGDLQQVAGQVPADRHPAGAARHPADRGRLRHRRQRHPQRVREGPRHRQGAEDRDPRRLAASPTRRSSAWSPTPRRTPTRTAGARARRGAQQRRERRLPGRAPAQGPRRPGRRGLQDARSRPAIADVRELADLRGRRRDQRQDRGAADGVPQGLRGHVRARPGRAGGAAGNGATAEGAGRRPAPPRRTSSTPRSWTRAARP